MTRVTPMKAGGIHHLVERAYRESGPLQYLREAVRNALEAGATRVEIGPEWQAVERHGVYRLCIADDGRGMEAGEMLGFLNTFGGGGKPIGDAHENFGVGVKTSTLPWNHHGLVVLSYTATTPEGRMVWLCRDPSTGEYGARKLRDAEGSYDEVVAPFDDRQEGVDWRSVKPDWMARGTVLVFLGNTGKEDTFLGKDGTDAVMSIPAYLNKRFWEIPEDVEIVAIELPNKRRSDWPRSKSDPERRRHVRGARHYVEYSKESFAQGALESSGSLELADGAVVHWYLWCGERPAIHAYAHENGFIAALYDDELYDLRSHPAHFRSFGFAHKELRDRITLVVEPARFANGEGVYPDTARNTLKRMGSGHAGEPLPWTEWGEEFVERMPEALRKAVARAIEGTSGTLDDEAWRERFVDRFGSRWKRMRHFLNPKGDAHTDPALAARDASSRSSADGTASESSALHGDNAGEPRGNVPASPRETRGGLPSYRWLSAEDLGEEDVAAVWQAKSTTNPAGEVQLNRDFPMFRELVDYWGKQYPDVYAPEVTRTIEEVYGETMVARIAHSELLLKSSAWGRQRVESQLRSNEALTMAALGLYAEDTILRARLAARLQKRKDSTVSG